MSATKATEDFHRLFYDTEAWKSIRWMGVGIEKCPFDLWMYQEILHETQPDLVVECGTRHGGSALFLANMCDLLKAGRVVTIDVQAPAAPPRHPRIEYVKGSSTDPAVVAKVRAAAERLKTVLVVLDSDHSKAHVLAEMRAYAPIVTKGSYLIVEDGNVNGHPVLAAHGPGPQEALREFLSECKDFEQDRSRERLYMTFNPGGYLRRVR